MILLVIAKILFLFLMVWLGFVNLFKSIQKNSLAAWTIFGMAVGIVGFVVIQFELYT